MHLKYSNSFILLGPIAQLCSFGIACSQTMDSEIYVPSSIYKSYQVVCSGKLYGIEVEEKIDNTLPDENFIKTRLHKLIIVDEVLRDDRRFIKLDNKIKNYTIAKLPEYTRCHEKGGRIVIEFPGYKTSLDVHLFETGEVKTHQHALD